MRELTIHESETVSGAGEVGDWAAEGGAVGTIAGYVYSGTLASAARGGIVGAMLGGSFGAGYGAGKLIVKVFEIGD